MGDILQLAKDDDSIHLVVSVITAGNDASVSLHNKFNFTFSGIVPEVGIKKGRYQDTETYTLLV